eukprot:CAMPEP_0169383846 /NCGR_PEP_ID=MMETSP1017-20121227/43040_1 /TAXON_ID=342587 /ORGANISM="Karlodinium micrum, Strain CCMP2283" /LENGTH=160 /DNA_ID=CAMNT_0009484221 /DNA_START=9 /DNA_END=491 /DNA_ORIENTATION=+
MLKDRNWTFKTLAWFKEIKAEREAEMRQREEEKAAKEAAKVAAAERAAAKEAAEAERRKESAARIAMEAAQAEALKNLRESEMVVPPKTGSVRSRSTHFSQRSRSSARLSNAGLLAVDGGDFNRSLARVSSTPDMNGGRLSTGGSSRRERLQQMYDRATK